MRRLAIAIAWVLFATACNEAEGQQSTEQKPEEAKVAPKTRGTRVEVATIGQSQPSLDLVLPGEVQGSRDAMLAAPLGGIVEHVFADVGDRVKAGKALAWVNKSEMEVRLQQAKIQLDQAASDLAIVERAGKSLPKSRRDQARFAHQAAEVAHQLAEINAKRAVVRAPFAGVVAQRRVEQGEVLPPGGPVMRLVSIDPLEISVSVADRDVVNLEEGMPVNVTTGARSGLFEGKIARISPAADPNTRTFEVIVRIPKTDTTLKPGMIATVRISVALKGEALAIPQYVLVTQMDGNGVFVDEDGVARWHPVELGNVVRGQVVVTSGIEPGDRVVVTGHRELADGDALLVAREGRCCVSGQVVFEGE